MKNYLKELIHNKEKEVDHLKQRTDLVSVPPRISNKSFRAALMKKHAIIAEIKRKSPSKSYFRDIIDPISLLKQYVDGGAAALSVLTDAYGFDGSIDDLKVAVNALKETATPVLRKDFIIDPIQISETVALGADAILLIVAVLKEKTKQLLNVAREMNIDALIEVMNQDELEYAIALSPDIIVVNNRDLTTFQVDSNRALTLRKLIPDFIMSVAASGMDSPHSVKKYFAANYHAVLVGEALVKTDNSTQFIQECHTI